MQALKYFVEDDYMHTFLLHVLARHLTRSLEGLESILDGLCAPHGSERTPSGEEEKSSFHFIKTYKSQLCNSIRPNDVLSWWHFVINGCR